MHNRVAESILSFVTSPERAGAILGDLLEAQLSPIAFWSSLLRATIAIGVHRPYRLLLCAFSLAMDVATFAIWIWVYTHVIGLSYLLSIIMLIPLELLFRWRWRLRQRRRNALAAVRPVS